SFLRLTLSLSLTVALPRFLLRTFLPILLRLGTSLIVSRIGSDRGIKVWIMHSLPGIVISDSGTIPLGGRIWRLSEWTIGIKSRRFEVRTRPVVRARSWRRLGRKSIPRHFTSIGSTIRIDRPKECFVLLSIVIYFPLTILLFLGACIFPAARCRC